MTKPVFSSEGSEPRVLLESEFTPENDPFRVRLKFSQMEKYQMVLFLVFVVPVRVLVAFISLVLAWAVSCIGLYGLDLSKPVTSGWRQQLQKMSCFLGQMCVRCVGFHTIEIVGQRVPKDVAPVLVVAPHSSFLDAFAIFWTGLPFFVNREENKNLLFFGKCIQFAQAIFVRREEPESRQETAREISRRVCSSEPWKQFLIFPEGTTSNRKALMTFKPGGFLPGKTVQPVLIRYKNQHDTVSWTWDQPHGFILCFLYTLCQPANYAQLEFMEPYTPSPDEVGNPKLFAENVRKVMAARLDVPLCNMTFVDIKAKYSKQKKSE